MQVFTGLLLEDLYSLTPTRVTLSNTQKIKVQQIGSHYNIKQLNRKKIAKENAKNFTPRRGFSNVSSLSSSLVSIARVPSAIESLQLLSGLRVLPLPPLPSCPL